MAGIPHDHYEPKGNFAKAVHSRLPIVGLLYDTLMIPTPKNLNWMWIWGIVLTFCLGLQIVTGIVLAMHYASERISSGIAPLALSAGIRLCSLSVTSWVLKPSVKGTSVRPC